jgi:hypothetical protein
MTRKNFVHIYHIEYERNISVILKLLLAYWRTDGRMDGEKFKTLVSISSEKNRVKLW